MCIFLKKYLVMSEKSSTFAVAFVSKSILANIKPKSGSKNASVFLPVRWVSG